MKSWFLPIVLLALLLATVAPSGADKIATVPSPAGGGTSGTGTVASLDAAGGPGELLVTNTENFTVNGGTGSDVGLDRERGRAEGRGHDIVAQSRGRQGAGKQKAAHGQVRLIFPPLAVVGGAREVLFLAQDARLFSRFRKQRYLAGR